MDRDDDREQRRAAAAEAIGVQACRPEDRAMLNTPAGRELLLKVKAAMTDLDQRERDTTVLQGSELTRLRDKFAGLAMHAELLSAGSFKGPALALAEAAKHEGRTIERQIAHNAYTLADAMLFERAAPEDQ